MRFEKKKNHEKGKQKIKNNFLKVKEKTFSMHWRAKIRKTFMKKE